MIIICSYHHGWHQPKKTSRSIKKWIQIAAAISAFIVVRFSTTRNAINANPEQWKCRQTHGRCYVQSNDCLVKYIFTLGTISTVEQAMMAGFDSWRWSGRIGRVRCYGFLYCYPMGCQKSYVEQNDHNKCNKGKKSKSYPRHDDNVKLGFNKSTEECGRFLLLFCPVTL